jgi:hypothetical protein
VPACCPPLLHACLHPRRQGRSGGDCGRATPAGNLRAPFKRAHKRWPREARRTLALHPPLPTLRVRPPVGWGGGAPLGGGGHPVVLKGRPIAPPPATRTVGAGCTSRAMGAPTSGRGAPLCLIKRNIFMGHLPLALCPPCRPPLPMAPAPKGLGPWGGAWPPIQRRGAMGRVRPSAPPRSSAGGAGDAQAGRMLPTGPLPPKGAGRPTRVRCTPARPPMSAPLLHVCKRPLRGSVHVHCEGPTLASPTSPHLPTEGGARAATTLPWGPWPVGVAPNPALAREGGPLGWSGHGRRAGLERLPPGLAQTSSFELPSYPSLWGPAEAGPSTSSPSGLPTPRPPAGASPPHRRWGGDARGAWPPHLRWGGRAGGPLKAPWPPPPRSGRPRRGRPHRWRGAP